MIVYPFLFIRSSSGGTGATGATGAGWFFYAGSSGPISPTGTTGPPTNNGNAIFVTTYIPANLITTYNPNYDGIYALNLYFNVNQADGTSYLTEFNTLDVSGGTIAISQGSNTAIYSGPSAAYTVLTPGTGSTGSYLRINSPTATLTQPASSPFVSGTPITITVS